MADQSAFVEVKAESASRTLVRLPPAIYARMRKAFERHGQEFDREMQLRLRKGGGGPQRRTGRLARSIGYRVSGEGLSDLTLHTYSAGVNYAGLQERGGTVRPKPPRRFLTIPMPDNLTAAGVPRFGSAAELRGSGKTFVFRNAEGKLFIGYRPSAKAKLRVLWRLVPSATIPPRLGFVDTWTKLEGNRAKRNLDAVEAAAKDAVAGAP